MDLAYYKMQWMAMEEPRRKALETSIYRRLAALSTGSMMLTNSAGLIQPSLGVFGTHQDFPNVSGMDCVENWAVSSAELQATEDARW
jgi:hypothetical protein